jgi:hypothetical protein
VRDDRKGQGGGEREDGRGKEEQNEGRERVRE